MLDQRQPRLRVCAPEDYAALYGLIGRAEGNLWDFRDFIPGPHQFVDGLWSGALGVYVGGEPSAVEFAARVHSVNYVSQHAELGLLLVPGVGVETSRAYASTFLTHLFWRAPLEKCVVRGIPGAYDPIAAVLGEQLIDEGSLRAHTYRDGRYVDVRLGAVFRRSVAESLP